MAPHLLMIGYIWPEATSSAAGVRDWEFVRIFLNQGWRITYASPSKESEHSEKLRAAGVVTQVVVPNDSRFDDWVRDLNPDFVLFDRFLTEEQFGWRVKDSCPLAVRVLDTQDLHFLRRWREKVFLEHGGSGEARLPDSRTQDEDSLREIASIYRSDLTLILSDVELGLLRTDYRVPDDLLMLSPFTYPPVPDVLPGFEAREHFAMIGNFRHPPNADAVKWLKHEIWPLIRARLPNSEVHVYGAYPPKEMMALTDSRLGLRMMGSVPDQFGMLKKYRVNLAPLRFGAGLKGKIADGWWSGIPAVTTPIGAEGMKMDDSAWGGEVRGTAADLAEAAVHLYQDRDAWITARDHGRRILQSRFERDRNGDLLVRQLLETRTILEGHRQNNFIGRMLWYHQLRSTTYFSRWIELKNSVPGVGF